MTDGLNLDGFTANRKPAGQNTIDAGYAANPGSAFPASDVSTQGNAGFNAEGSYDTGTRAESNAYPESENM
jgi:hypothetical protein